MAAQRMHIEGANHMTLKEVTWEQIKNRVAKINPELASIINDINPPNDFTFILACYPYGTDIRKDGKGYFPTKNGLLTTIDDSATSENVKKCLSYSASPLGLILSKSIEIYVETPENRTIPFKVFSPGTTFGVWEIMEAPQITLRQGWNWNISSGGRTVFMPTSINEAASYSKIQRKYKIKSYLPNTIFDHQKIFAEIAQASQDHWCTEILFFTEKWVKQAINNPKWARLHAHWSQQAWKQLMHWSNKMITEFNWESFIAELTLRKIKLKPYLLDTVKHLINIACGTIPGFIPVDDSELVIPSKTIQEAYINDYGLKLYTPLLMRPEFLSPNHEFQHVYYSLQYPTLPEKPSELQSFPSVMKMIRELKNLIEIFMDVMNQWPKNNMREGALDFLDTVKFDFFHVEKDKYGEVRQTTELTKEDPMLTAYPKKHQRKFPDGAHFFRGCVRISLIKNKM